MKFQQLFKIFLGSIILALVAFSSIAAAQSGNPTLIINNRSREQALAGPNNLYCAGYVVDVPVNTSMKIVGAQNEQEQYILSQGNDLYINAGSNKGVKVGDMLSVIRPRGQVNTPWSKKGSLGFYVMEVGALEVIRVKQEVSVVQVRTSCDNLMYGDLVQPTPQRTSPMYTERPELDVFADASGRATGRIFLSRDSRELLSSNQIVFVDLGSEDGLKSGDYLTVYRPLGTGGLLTNPKSESAAARNAGFESDKFRGGKFSNQTARKKGGEAKGKVETTEAARSDRPSGLRKVVGELVVLSVQGKTATAMITRVAQEIHTGDWVEMQ